MGAKLREALVQCAHLIADAIEAERDERPSVKKAAPIARPRRRCEPPEPPPGVGLSEVDMARARKSAKRAGIPIP